MPARDVAEQDGVPDIVGPGLRVLFCGINPGLTSAAKAQHFARPGNRFWPVLHRSGFTPTLLRPDQQHLLPSWGLGITNVVPRPTAKAAELSPAELRAGGERLRDLVIELGPRWLAVLGVTAYRVAFAEPRAAVGPQPRTVGGTGLWVLPNPSGLNAHYSADALVAEFARLRAESGL